MYEGEDLASLSGRRPSLLGLNAATRVLGEDVLKAYRISPQKSTGRPALPSEYKEKLDVVKSKSPSI